MKVDRPVRCRRPSPGVWPGTTRRLLVRAAGRHLVGRPRGALTSGTSQLEIMAAGTLSLSVALAAGSTALLALTGARSEPPSDQRVELEVVAVLPMPQGPAGLLVLRERASGTLLPVLVPDGSAIDVSPRKGAGPEAGGLAGRAIAALGGRVREVEIDSAEESSTASRIRLAQGSHDVELRARPSESVPLAVAAGARIVTTRRLLAASGLTPDELESVHEATKHGAETRL